MPTGIVARKKAIEPQNMKLSLSLSFIHFFRKENEFKKMESLLGCCCCNSLAYSCLSFLTMRLCDEIRREEANERRLE